MTGSKCYSPSRSNYEANAFESPVVGDAATETGRSSYRLLRIWLFHKSTKKDTESSMMEARTCLLIRCGIGASNVLTDRPGPYIDNLKKGAKSLFKRYAQRP